MRISLWVGLLICILYTIIPAESSETVTASLMSPALSAPVPPTEPAMDEPSAAQEQVMWQEIQQNIALLRSTHRLATPQATPASTYIFPLQLAPGLNDAAGFRVSAFVDHSPASGQALDYNGGTRTYDGHRGTDYALSPFPWNKLDAGDVQVIAAAAGTIIAKANVDLTDHNCGSSSNDPWNYIALTHADGRMTIYGHLRYNSLTPKAVGQTVAQGELLATAGSSGNSSGPHLHFEMRYGSYSNTEWIDPYAGPNSQPTSLWVNQRPYYDSAINKLATHVAPPNTPDPCQPSILNLQDTFVTPSRIYFYAYYRDYQGALDTQLQIYRPDGSLYQSWSYLNGGTPFASSWNHGWVYDFNDLDPAGIWRFEATYNNQTTRVFFTLQSSASLTNPVYLPFVHRHA